MIVKRFRSVGWVGCVATAALGCYLVSQRVASERAAAEQLDRRILMARIDIRKLQTELGTRSRMPVLEQWNSDVLALSAPMAQQYLHGEVQLARFEVRPAAPRIEQVSAPSAVRTPGVVLAVARERGDVAPAEPMLRHANYVKPADASFEPLAQRTALLDDAVLGELRQAARTEKPSGELAR